MIRKCVEQQRQVAKLWHIAKEHGQLFSTKPKQLPCPGLVHHFQTHFNPDHSHLRLPEDIETPPECITRLQNLTLEMDNNHPTLDKIHTAINNLHNGKASIDIEADLIKAAMEVPEFNFEFFEYFRNIW